jgi:hypothetical protein
VVVAGSWKALENVLPSCELLAATLEDFDHKAPAGLAKALQEATAKKTEVAGVHSENDNLWDTFNSSDFSLSASQIIRLSLRQSLSKLLVVDPTLEQIVAVQHCLGETAAKLGAGAHSNPTEKVAANNQETLSDTKLTFSFTGHGSERVSGLQYYGLADNRGCTGLNEKLKLMAQEKQCKLLLVSDACRTRSLDVKEKEMGYARELQLKLRMGWWHHASSSSCGTESVGEFVEGTLSNWSHLLYKVWFVHFRMYMYLLKLWVACSASRAIISHYA